MFNIQNKENDAKTQDDKSSKLLGEPSQQKVRRSVLKEFDPFAPDSPQPPQLRHPSTVDEEEIFKDAETSLATYLCPINRSFPEIAPSNASYGTRESILIPELKDYRPVVVGLNDTGDLSFAECFESLSELNNSRNVTTSSMGDVEYNYKPKRDVDSPKDEQKSIRNEETFEAVSTESPLVAPDNVLNATEREGATEGDENKCSPSQAHAQEPPKSLGDDTHMTVGASAKGDCESEQHQIAFVHIQLDHTFEETSVVCEAACCDDPLFIEHSLNTEKDCSGQEGTLELAKAGRSRSDVGDDSIIENDDSGAPERDKETCQLNEEEEGGASEFNEVSLLENSENGKNVSVEIGETAKSTKEGQGRKSNEFGQKNEETSTGLHNIDQNDAQGLPDPVDSSLEYPSNASFVISEQSSVVSGQPEGADQHPNTFQATEEEVKLKANGSPIQSEETLIQTSQDRPEHHRLDNARNPDKDVSVVSGQPEGADQYPNTFQATEEEIKLKSNVSPIQNEETLIQTSQDRPEHHRLDDARNPDKDVSVVSGQPEGADQYPNTFQATEEEIKLKSNVSPIQNEETLIQTSQDRPEHHRLDVARNPDKDAEAFKATIDQIDPTLLNKPADGTSKPEVPNNKDVTVETLSGNTASSGDAEVFAATVIESMEVTLQKQLDDAENCLRQREEDCRVPKNGDHSLGQPMNEASFVIADGTSETTDCNKGLVIETLCGNEEGSEEANNEPSQVTISISEGQNNLETPHQELLQRPMNLSFVVEALQNKTISERAPFEHPSLSEAPTESIISIMPDGTKVNVVISGPEMKAEVVTEPINSNEPTRASVAIVYVANAVENNAEESERAAEALAESLNQTIDVEESAIVDDIDNLDITIQASAKVADDNSAEAEELSEKSAARNEDFLADFKEQADKSSDQPTSNKRIQGRPHIRALRNMTQVITNPLLVTAKQTNEDEDLLNGRRKGSDPLMNDVDRLQNELEEIQEDNICKHQCIRSHAIDREANEVTVLKYRKLIQEHQEFIRRQCEDLCKMKVESERLAGHFTSTEMAFSAVFEKYEKSKSAIAGFRKNEAILTQNIKNAELQLAQLEAKYEISREQHKQELKKAQEQLNQNREAYKQYVTKLQMTAKRLEIKATSLESSLKQKSEECQALAALYDDISG